MPDIDILLAEQLGYDAELNWQEWLKIQQEEEVEVING